MLGIVDQVKALASIVVSILLFHDVALLDQHLFLEILEQLDVLLGVTLLLMVLSRLVFIDRLASDKL